MRRRSIQPERSSSGGAAATTYLRTCDIKIRHCSGFTLLEVLAAIALLAITFAIGLGALGKAAQNTERGAALNIAVERAQSLLAEQGLEAPLHDQSLTGKFDDGMTWTLKVHGRPRAAVSDDSVGVVPQQQGNMQAQASGIDLYQLDVAVQYGAGRVLHLSTQRAQAAQATPQ